MFVFDYPKQKTVIPEPESAAQKDAGIPCEVHHQLLSESIDMVYTVKADLSIPDLHQTVSKEVRTWNRCLMVIWYLAVGLD